MRLSLVVAMARSGVIGRAGNLPWRLSADLQRFKALTMGHHLILGSSTFFSLGKLLPGRILLVLTHRASPYGYECLDEQGQPVPGYDQVIAARRAGLPDPGRFNPVAFVHSLDEALQLADGDTEVFVIGGGQIYDLSLNMERPRISRLYVTWVEASVEGDTFFPAVDWNQWREISSERHSADAKNEYDTTFCIYDRIPAES